MNEADREANAEPYACDMCDRTERRLAESKAEADVLRTSLIEARRANDGLDIERGSLTSQMHNYKRHRNELRARLAASEQRNAELLKQNRILQEQVDRCIEGIMSENV